MQHGALDVTEKPHAEHSYTNFCSESSVLIWGPPFQPRMPTISQIICGIVVVPARITMHILRKCRSELPYHRTIAARKSENVLLVMNRRRGRIWRNFYAQGRRARNSCVSLLLLLNNFESFRTKVRAVSPILLCGDSSEKGVSPYIRCIDYFYDRFGISSTDHAGAIGNKLINKGDLRAAHFANRYFPLLRISKTEAIFYSFDSSLFSKVNVQNNVAGLSGQRPKSL